MQNKNWNNSSSKERSWTGGAFAVLLRLGVVHIQRSFVPTSAAPEHRRRKTRPAMLLRGISDTTVTPDKHEAVVNFDPVSAPSAITEWVLTVGFLEYLVEQTAMSQAMGKKRLRWLRPRLKSRAWAAARAWPTQVEDNLVVGPQYWLLAQGRQCCLVQLAECHWYVVGNRMAILQLHKGCTSGPESCIGEGGT